ncbi:MAG: ABC transporter permease, partial [Deltaproteobacteria bacterium]|nr:ABC transporter permease [Deltaproteobacteria bacterium]
MYKLLSIILKEFLLLWRDRAGLAVLFIMPAILLLAITSTQHNVMMTINRPQVRILLVDHDKGPVSEQIISFFSKIPSIEMKGEVDGRALNKQEAFDRVAKGEYQFSLFIPSGISQNLEDSVINMKTPFVKEGEIKADRSDKEQDNPVIELFYDPIVQGAWRSAVEQSLKSAIFAIETKEGYKKLLGILSKTPGMPLYDSEDQTGGLKNDISGRIPEDTEMESLLDVDVKSAVTGKSRKIPNEVQQNIPAWTLFGMFFIVVPLSGALIRERQEGTLTRLFTLPVPFLTLLIGKILAYITICLIQCVLMFLVGMTLLPLQGLPPLELGSSPAALFLVVLSASFAATGFGLMVGSVARTYEQASMFGSVSVVIGAAVGGAMFPVYVMPEFMQKISSLSPFSWGLDAFLEIFIRGGDFRAVFSQSLCLILFGSVAMGIA